MKPEEHFDTKRSTLDEIHESFFDEHNVRLLIKRDDRIHKDVSGNKWRKLKYNVLKCLDRKNEGIITFGGAYSNHLVATSAACKELGLKSIGIIRGDELNAESNVTLKRCSDNGMNLVFVSREEYSQRNEKYYQDEVVSDHPNYWLVPEGGANYYGVLGCQEILGEIDADFDEVFVAQGTTTTSVGVALSIPMEVNLNVIPVLKGFNSIQEMKALLSLGGFESGFVEEALEDVHVNSNFHFGGYGKYNDELLSFVSNFYKNHKIKLDPIYTGKVMYGIYDAIMKGQLQDKTILFIHTGGIQGASGIEDKAGRRLYA